jgi:hypothetical protein
MNLDLLSQIAVTVFGLSALWLMLADRLEIRRWGVVCGLVGQPAWYTQLVLHEQWGMVPVFVGYTAAWAWGAWTHWVRPARSRRSARRWTPRSSAR